MAMLNNQRVYSCFLAYASSYPRCFMVMVWPAGLLASPCVSLKFPLCLVQSSLCCLNSVCSIHFPRLLLKFIVSLFNPNHYMLIPRIHSLGSFPFPFPGVCSAGLPSDYLIFKIAWFLMILIQIGERLVSPCESWPHRGDFFVHCSGRDRRLCISGRSLGFDGFGGGSSS